jgi:hypothetical protein
VLVSTINVGDGQNCTRAVGILNPFYESYTDIFVLQLTTTTCTGSGTGTVQYIASGSVWFYYDKKVYTDFTLLFECLANSSN